MHFLNSISLCWCRSVGQFFVMVVGVVVLPLHKATYFRSFWAFHEFHMRMMCILCVPLFVPLLSPHASLHSSLLPSLASQADIPHPISVFPQKLLSWLSLISPVILVCLHRFLQPHLSSQVPASFINGMFYCQRLWDFFFYYVSNSRSLSLPYSNTSSWSSASSPLFQSSWRLQHILFSTSSLYASEALPLS